MFQSTKKSLQTLLHTAQPQPRFVPVIFVTQSSPQTQRNKGIAVLPRAPHLTLRLEQGGLEGQKPSALCPHLSLGSSQGWVCRNTSGCGVRERGAHASTSLGAHRTASALQLSPSRPAWNEVARNVSRNPFLTPNVTSPVRSWLLAMVQETKLSFLI